MKKNGKNGKAAAPLAAKRLEDISVPPATEPEIPEFLAGMINAKAEEDPVVRALADKEGVALIAFIAPSVGVRISPVDEAQAVISQPDEFGVEAVIKAVANAGVKRAFLLVNSPGGLLDCAYKIARAIRSALDEIVVFVPHIAASGGTLLALTGNEIVMGPMSHITPLDVQLSYKGTRISAATFMRSFNRAIQWFSTVTPEEAPYPKRAMTDQLDPFLMEEWNGFMATALQYVDEILTISGNSKHEEIARKLVYSFPTHSYVINAAKAKDLGLNVTDASSRQKTWDVMRYWLGTYLFKQEMMHHIRYVLPSNKSPLSPMNGGGSNGKK